MFRLYSPFQKRLAVVIGMVIILVCGVGFRFWDLKRAVVWCDEGMTLIWVSGNTYATAYPKFARKIMTFKQLNTATQRPSRKTTGSDVLFGLTDCALYRPALYLTLFYWGKLVGFDIGRLRMLPALIGMLGIVAAYWLGLELFRSKCSALLAAALVSVSPLAVHYSREIREGSLIMLLSLLSSASFLRAYRTGKLSHWLVYALIVACGLYSSFSISSIFAVNFIFACINRRTSNIQWKKPLIGTVLATTTGLVIASPNIIDLASNYEKSIKWIAWTDQAAPSLFLITTWLMNFAIPFVMRFEFDFAFHLQSSEQYLVRAVCCVAVLFSMVTVYRFDRRAFAYLGLICLWYFGLLFLPDLIRGGIKSVVVRYNLPFYLALLYFVVFSLSHYLQSCKNWQRKAAKTAVVLAIGCCVSGSVYDVLQLERSIAGPLQTVVYPILRKDPDTLVVGANALVPNMACFRGLSHKLKKNRMLWLNKVFEVDAVPAIGIQRFYLLNPPPDLLARVTDTLHCKAYRVNEFLYLVQQED